jgi:hypothetical protein
VYVCTYIIVWFSALINKYITHCEIDDMYTKIHRHIMIVKNNDEDNLLSSLALLFDFLP